MKTREPRKTPSSQITAEIKLVAHPVGIRFAPTKRLLFPGKKSLVSTFEENPRKPKTDKLLRKLL